MLVLVSFYLFSGLSLLGTFFGLQIAHEAVDVEHGEVLLSIAKFLAQLFLQVLGPQHIVFNAICLVYLFCFCEAAREL